MQALSVKPLEVTMPSDREIFVTRAFNAPRTLVWDCHTKPELVQRWMLGPPNWTMPVCEMDVRVGGRFRWRWRSDADGKEFGFVGEFRAVEAPAKLTHTEGFDGGSAGEEALVTMKLVETGGRTMLTMSILFASKEERDRAAATGMTDGMEIGYQRLDAIVAELA